MGLLKQALFHRGRRCDGFKLCRNRGKWLIIENPAPIAFEQGFDGNQVTYLHREMIRQHPVEAMAGLPATGIGLAPESSIQRQPVFLVQFVDQERSLALAHSLGALKNEISH